VQYGNVTCDSDEKDQGARLEIVVPEKGAGRWALRHPGRGYFLGASSDKLTCSTKTPTENELWYASTTQSNRLERNQWLASIVWRNKNYWLTGIDQGKTTLPAKEKLVKTSSQVNTAR